ncbi:alkyl sulfatase dimerization domain-containing protein [Thermodesulfobacteriota bacterium]
MRTRLVLLPVIVALASMLLSCGRKEPDVTPAPEKLVSTPHKPDFSKRVEKVTDNVYCAVGYSLSNCIMVVVDGGKVIIDTTESVVAAREIKASFDELAPGPVKTIIYTHSHPDHILGTSVFYEPGVPIWTHERFLDGMNDQMTSIADTIRRRGAKQFGEFLSASQRESCGIGPTLRLDDGPIPPMIYPTETFIGSAGFIAGGVRFELHEAPGETHDQIFVWIPEWKVLFPGDNVYQAFPNLYSTRGVRPRPVRQWIASIDHMRALAPEVLVPSHTGVVKGRDEIASILTAYRDAIAFLHDSVIRMANEGKSVDDMVRLIRLPDHLRDHPYLQESYGKVSWSVRGIYDGYLGWFDGNPTSLGRLHPAESAARLVPMLGGREAVLASIDTALGHEEMQWAAELSDLLLALDPGDDEAARAKATALEWLGLRDFNANASSYLITSAMELRGDYEPPPRPEIGRETLRDVPVEVVIRSLTARLKPEETADVMMTVAFEFTDTGRDFTFIIRRGVGEVNARRAEGPDLKLTCTEPDFKAFLTGAMNPVTALAAGRIKISGGIDDLLAFRSYLIRP